MEVYSDFVCPYSREAAPVVRELMRRYDGRLNVSFRHFPLTKHPSAWVAAEAAECARDQGKFWEFHDALFNASGDVGNLDVLDDLGEDVSLNLDKFDDCIDSGAKKQFVAASKQEGMERNVSSTPTFIIGDRRIAAAVNIEAYEIMIDEELAKANASRTA
jgi:protein-disulfide isomerase